MDRGAGGGRRDLVSSSRFDGGRGHVHVKMNGFNDHIAHKQAKPFVERAED